MYSTEALCMKIDLKNKAYNLELFYWQKEILEY